MLNKRLALLSTLLTATLLAALAVAVLVIVLVLLVLLPVTVALAALLILILPVLIVILIAHLALLEVTSQVNQPPELRFHPLQSLYICARVWYRTDSVFISRQPTCCGCKGSLQVCSRAHSCEQQ